MSATSLTFGEGSWGIGADETGLLIESVSHEFTNEQHPMKNRTGNTVGATFYDEKVKISLDGRMPVSAPFSGTLAASITLQNTLGNYLKGGVSGGLTLVDSITIDSNQEDYKSIKIGATFYPNLSA